MIKNFNKVMSKLTELVNLLDDTYPDNMRLLSRMYYTSAFTDEDDAKLKLFIDKLIAETVNIEIYEVSAQLLKIKNMI